MNQQVANLEPKAVFTAFEQLNAVPRPSKREAKVIQFICDFADSLGLPFERDAVGNVLISKPATAAYSHKPTVVLQAHLDMVHQKNNDTPFDFENQGIQSYLDGDWVKAKGTTLGADNGIGVAMIMAILQANDLSHPAIEALFTIDEETGMTGAINLQPNWLKGKLLFNLDTEDDSELCFGCAGGIDTNTTLAYKPESVESGSIGFKIMVKGLLGGHSGMDIHKERGNANKIMNSLLLATTPFNIQLSSIHGGSLRNAIPRESVAIIAVPQAQAASFTNQFQQTADNIKKMLLGSEPHLQIGLEPCPLPQAIVPAETFRKITLSIAAVHNGVYRWSTEMENLVETSSSLAKVVVENGLFATQSLQRSSIETGKDEIAMAVKAAFSLAGCDVAQGGAYPGWAPNAKSPALMLLKQVYTHLFNQEPQILACHAGLECGILGSHYPELHMVSFGPTIKNAHSPDECVSVSSVQKSWQLLIAAIASVPDEI